jgi:hypothetical protein
VLTLVLGDRAVNMVGESIVVGGVEVGGVMVECVVVEGVVVGGVVVGGVVVGVVLYVACSKREGAGVHGVWRAGGAETASIGLGIAVTPPAFSSLPLVGYWLPVFSGKLVIGVADGECGPVRTPGTTCGPFSCIAVSLQAIYCS